MKLINLGQFFKYKQNLQLNVRLVRNISDLKHKALKVAFFGTDEFSLTPLEKLVQLRNETNLVEEVAVVSQFETQKKSTKGIIPVVHRYVRENELPKIHWEELKINPKHHLDHDLAIVASFGEFIPSKVIKCFPKGAINIHPSLLPRWRGASPLIHTILAGDTVTGISFIEISPKKFDIGKILYQAEFQIPPRCTTENLRDILSNKAADLLPEVIDNLPTLRENSIDQDDSETTHAPKISKTVGYIDFHEQNCDEIERTYRAVGQRVGIKSLWGGKQVKLENIVDIKMENESEITPGTCQYSKKERMIWIKCKTGWVGVDGFQFDQRKKIISAQSFYNGYVIDKQTGKPGSTKFETMIE
eukprot:TCONS_00058456-protein